MTDTNIAPENNISGKTKKTITRAILRAGDYLGLTDMEQASILGITEELFVKIKQNDIESLAEDDFGIRSILFIRLFKALHGITGGDREAAASWMRNHNIFLNAVPVTDIQNLPGLRHTVDYLETASG